MRVLRNAISSSSSSKKTKTKTQEESTSPPAYTNKHLAVQAVLNAAVPARESTSFASSLKWSGKYDDDQEFASFIKIFFCSNECNEKNNRKKEAKTLFRSFSLILLTFKAQRKEISKLSHHVSNGNRSHHHRRRLLRVVVIVVVVRNARFCIVFLPSRVSGFCWLHFNFTISDL